MSAPWLAVLALVPIAVGPLPSEPATFAATLCAGGAIEIPLRDGDDGPRGDCHQKACHAGNCREKSKRTN